MGDATIILTGNLTHDPDLRVLPSGVPLCRLRVASTPRLRGEDGQWSDGTPLFVSVSCFRRLAEHVQASLRRGDPVVVTGRLRARSWTAADGSERTGMDIDADSVAVDLRRATATAERISGAESAWEPAGGDPYAVLRGEADAAPF